MDRERGRRVGLGVPLTHSCWGVVSAQLSQARSATEQAEQLALTTVREAARRETDLVRSRAFALLLLLFDCDCVTV